MTHALYLALAYLRFHGLRSIVLILAIALIVAMPLMTRAVLNAAEAMLALRAEATPLVVGAKGSALDVLMNALYFTDDIPGPLTLAASEEIWQSGYAVPVPILQRYRASGLPIVGTTLDYFDMRGLKLAQGRAFAILGEAVLGADAAADLELDVGDRLISDPVNLFDLTGSYPIRMTVAGILAPSGTADDRAVFTDLKTTWVIAGLGHGHDDLLERPDMVIGQKDGGLIANRGLQLYADITAENAKDFHFHGKKDDYPITAVLAFPEDRRAGTILRGRYVFPDIEEQIVVAEEVIADLLATVFKIGRILDGVIAIAALAALIALGLAIYLSLKLRETELETLFKLGGRRLTVVKMVLAELAVVVAASLSLAGLALWAIQARANDLAYWLLNATS